MFRKLLSSGPRYSWKKVVLIVCVSSTCVSGVWSGLYTYNAYRNSHATSVIEAVVHTGRQLPTTYLAEVLELSRDHPTQLHTFDLKAAKQRLLATHVLEDVALKKIKPDKLFIDYTLRTPIAYLADYTNTALGQHGALFPAQPVYTPRTLPKVYLGGLAPPQPWGAALADEQMRTVQTILEAFGPQKLQQIDLSQSRDPSAGARQIVLTLEEGRLLRLNPKNVSTQLAHYFMLEANMPESVSVIDLRTPELAFIQYDK